MLVWVTLPKTRTSVILEKVGDTFKFPKEFSGSSTVAVAGVAFWEKYNAPILKEGEKKWGEVGELDRLLMISIIENAPHKIGLPFLIDRSHELAWPIWMLSPLFERLNKNNVNFFEPTNNPSFKDAITRLYKSEETANEAFPTSKQLEEEDAAEDVNDEDDREVEEVEIKPGLNFVSLKLSLGWSHAKAGGPNAQGGEFYNIFREGGAFAKYRTGGWVIEEVGIIPKDSVFQTYHRTWTDDFIKPIARDRDDLVDKLSSWLNRAQLANEYSHTGTIAHARLVLDVLFKNNGINLQGMTNTKCEELFLNHGMGFEKGDMGNWMVNQSLLKFVSDEGHDRTYGTKTYANNARLELILKLVSDHLKTHEVVDLEEEEEDEEEDEDGEDVVEDEWRGRVLAMEPNLYNPYMAFQTDERKRKYRFMQTRADLILHFRYGKTKRTKVVIVEFKTLMGTSVNISTRVTQADSLRQAITNAFLLASCTGICASYAVVYYTTPYLEGFTGDKAYAFLFRIDPRDAWQNKLFKRLTTNPFYSKGGAVYSDESYTMSWDTNKPTLEKIRSRLTRCRINRLLEYWGDELNVLDKFYISACEELDRDDCFPRNGRGDIEQSIYKAPWKDTETLGRLVPVLAENTLLWIKRDRRIQLEEKAFLPPTATKTLRGKLFTHGPPADNFANPPPIGPSKWGDLRILLNQASITIADGLVPLVKHYTVRQIASLTKAGIPLPLFTTPASTNRQKEDQDTVEQRLYRFVNRLVNYYVLELFVHPDKQFDPNADYSKELFHHNSRRDLWGKVPLENAVFRVIPYVSLKARAILRI